MKIIITEEQLKLITDRELEILEEQGILDDIKLKYYRTKYGVKRALRNVKRGVTDFLTNAYNSAKGWVEKYAGKLAPIQVCIGIVGTILMNSDISKFKRICIVFPKAEWESDLLNILKKFAAITGFYKSVGEAKLFLDTLTKKGIRGKEIIIGSHGDYGTLLYTQKEGGFYLNNSFLSSFKGIIQSDSIVFFTACHGADQLASLKDAAEKLGVGVYGASGIYNYVTNKAENGFYYCKAGPFTDALNKKPTNKFLLDKNYCQKVNKAPITWVKGII